MDPCLDLGQEIGDSFSRTVDTVALLKKADFFSGLSAANLKRLGEISIPKTVMKGDPLFSEAQEGSYVYILAEGAVQLFKTAQDGKVVVIKTLRPGEVFGEVVLFEQTRYPVSARAVARSKVLQFSRIQVDCLLVGESFRRDFIGMLMKKQRYLTERILQLTTDDVEHRFFRFLKEQYGTGDHCRIAMSKKDLAASIGTIPETLSRLVLRLKNEGTMRWEGNDVFLKPGFWDGEDTSGR